jgi:hypothetical protein
MTTAALPAKGTRSHTLLVVLQQGPGTFYQVCERAGFDIEDTRLEYALRKIFDRLIGGNARVVGIIYHLTDDARRALEPVAATAPPYVGQVAGPAYRGTPHLMPVTIARRAAGARA